MFISIKKLINYQLQEKEEKEMQERKEIQIDNMYCKKVKKELEILKKSEKNYKNGWFIIIILVVLLILFYSWFCYNLEELANIINVNEEVKEILGSEDAKDIIKVTMFPMVVYIITDWTLEKRRKIEKIDKLKEQFYTVAKPLYIKGKLDKDLEKFFEDEFLKNDDSSKDKCKKRDKIYMKLKKC